MTSVVHSITSKNTPEVQAIKPVTVGRKPIEAEDLEKLQGCGTSLASNHLRIAEKNVLLQNDSRPISGLERRSLMPRSPGLQGTGCCLLADHKGSRCRVIRHWQEPSGVASVRMAA